MTNPKLAAAVKVALVLSVIHNHHRPTFLYLFRHPLNLDIVICHQQPDPLEAIPEVSGIPDLCWKG